MKVIIDGIEYTPVETTQAEETKTAVHCPTRESYNELMQAYEAVGWKWYSGREKPHEFDGWTSDKDQTCIHFNDVFLRSDLKDRRARNYTIMSVEEAITKLKEMYPDKFEPEPKTYARFPNGALAEFPGGEDLIQYDAENDCIDEEGEYDEYYHTYYNFLMLQKKLFLKGERELCIKAGKQALRKLEIERDMALINHQENWKTDWSDANQEKYYIVYIHDSNKFGEVSAFEYRSYSFYMCEKAIDTLLSDKYTDEDRKAFLGIID